MASLSRSPAGSWGILATVGAAIILLSFAVEEVALKFLMLGFSAALVAMGGTGAAVSTPKELRGKVVVFSLALATVMFLLTVYFTASS